MQERINDINILKEKLNELWYKYFWENNILKEYADAFFQKKVMQWDKIKYFINIYVYHIPDFSNKMSIEFEFQFTKENEEKTLNWTLFWGKEITIEKIKKNEKEIDNIWTLLKYDFY